MSSFFRTAAFVLATTALALVVFPVSAQLPENVNEVAGELNLPAASEPTEIMSTVQKIVNVLLSIVGLVAVMVIIYAGIMYIISLGDEGKTEKAKHAILYAVIGLIIIGLSAIIVNFTLGAIRGGVDGGGGGGGNNHAGDPPDPE